MSSYSVPSIGQRLKQERKLLHWSQERLAQAVGTTVASINRWENDKVLPQPHYRERLCHIYNQPVQALFSNIDAQVTELPASKPSIWYVPYLRNIYFTGRQPMLDTIHATFSRSSPVPLPQLSMLCGLGGIGKTQLALEYVYSYGHEYDTVVWGRADTFQSLNTDFLTIAHTLSLAQEKDADHSHVIAAVVHWFHTHQNWLLVLDNIDEMDRLSEYIPTSGKGHVLLTSRNQLLGPHIESIELHSMCTQEAIQLLLYRAKMIKTPSTISHVTAQMLQDAEVICTTLGGLPLALDQAAAYIDESKCDLRDYISLYALQHSLLLRRRGDGWLREYPKAVSTTWQLSFERLKHLNGTAIELLQLFAFLHPDAISETMIKRGAQGLPPSLRAAVENSLLFNDAITTLRRFSLISRSPINKILTIHRLVQTILLDTLSAEQKRCWAECVVRVVNSAYSAFPEGEHVNWPLCQEYLPQAHACALLIERWQLLTAEAASLLDRVGAYLSERGQYAEAERFLQHGLTIRAQIFSPGRSTSYARSLYHLGWLYLTLKKPERAEPLFCEALAIQQHSLPSDHAELADTLNSLGWLYLEGGKYQLSEPLLQRTLTLRLHLFNPPNAAVAESLNELASLYVRQGKYALAETNYLHSIDVLQKLPDRPHPYLPIFLNNLAKLYIDQKRYAESEALFQQCLSEAVRMLGSEHPNIIIGHNNLALLYLHADRLDEAEVLLTRTLQQVEKIWGQEHMHTLTTRFHLATLASKQQRYQEAQTLAEHVLQLRERQLGSEHPDVLPCLLLLADLYHIRGCYEQAVAYYRRALIIQEHIYSSQHPLIIQTLQHLATLLHMMSLEQDAAAIEERLRLNSADTLVYGDHSR